MTAQPGPIERARAEDIAARPVERVPVANGYPKVILHPLAQDLTVWLVDTKSQVVVGVETSEPNRPGDIGKELIRHGQPPLALPLCTGGTLFMLVARGRSGSVPGSLRLHDRGPIRPAGRFDCDVFADPTAEDGCGQG